MSQDVHAVKIALNYRLYDYGAPPTLDELAGNHGWHDVEQDWVPAPGEDPADQIASQERNRRWLAEHVAL